MASRRVKQLANAGSRAPDFRLERLEGGTATLAELLAGGPVLLAFFKISCPVCQFTFPFLERIHTAGSPRIVGISQDDAADTRAYNREFGVTFPTLLDREELDFPASNAYGISSVPTLFLVERSGAIARVMEGWRKQEIEALAGPAGGSLFTPNECVPEWKAG